MNQTKKQKVLEWLFEAYCYGIQRGIGTEKYPVLKKYRNNKKKEIQKW
jgi:hypothetical protein